MTRTEFLNCYERDELYERWELELAEWLDDVEDLAYADDDNIDDHDLKATYYPEELWQMETINLRFTLDAECPIEEYLDDGLCTEYFPLDDQTYQIIIKDVDETLIESMNPDDLAEFFGIESEFVIAMEVI